MTPLEQLAHRAAACPRWRWVPGMAATCKDGGPRGVVLTGWRVLRASRRRPGEVVCEAKGESHNYSHPVDRLLPDLTDPATLGCLRHLVCEAWGDTTVGTFYGSDGLWVVDVLDGQVGVIRSFRAKTLGGALVVALEAAP